MQLSPLVQRFVLHFGEMGSRWGINRTVGQIYALLFTAARPLNADQIAEALGFSRSNVSIGLKELESWHLVKLSHQPGDRREYFSAPDDVWAIFRTLAEERRRREIDPTLSMLREVQLESPADPDDRHAQQRMTEMYQLILLVTSWFGDMQRLDVATLEKLMRLGSRVTRLLEAKDKLSGALGGKATRAAGSGKSSRSKQ
ncbi:ArsR family transcriptional regulator [Cupriavidus sp. USMAA2-4]|uniref:HTH-type transcriptional regulator n=1 Tax=Cupriavidus malaysiensis TaxID=367825 RepID=A0A1D9IDY8_9BURK|nr:MULTISPECIES: GbsR/MarR family transcriptional regulator [Cupriavidus]AOY94703.1 ArsR family transcriptional regulator [Cupriavidus sp. USMAA2-4]AOZ02433.1 ArsR family transcriptional regulator [Cupriavidus sp. USMAHM13]AOZ10195.1 ArsR family transcriptional regulator [Cupriavidus malaysiensis]